MKHLFTTALFLLAIRQAGAQNTGIGTIAPTDQLHTTGSVRLQNYSGIGTRLMYIDSAGRITPPPTGTLFSNNTPTFIPDNGCSTGNGATSTVVVSGQPASVSTAKISVRVNITHPFDQDLVMLLVAPTGQSIVLCSGTATGANFTGTIFADDAVNSTIASSAAPYTGRYYPANTAGSFCLLTPTALKFADLGSGGNINPNGTWALKIFDNISVGTGTLNSWQITFEGQGAFGTAGLNGTVPYFKNGTLSTTNINYYPAGRVSIGSVASTSNQLTLEVEDAPGTGLPMGINSKSNGGTLLYIGNTGGASAGTLMHQGSNNVYTTMKANGEYALLFGNSTERFTFTPAGRLGIGTTGPQQPLSVNGNANVDQADTSAGNSPDLTFGASSGEGLGSARPGSAPNSAGLDFYTSFQKRMSITNGGNVGVGLINPQQNLSVKAGINLDQAEANGNNMANALHFGSSSGEGIGSNRAVSTAGTNYYGLDLYTAGINRIAITNTGNIGFGTTAPGFPLNFSNALGDKISFYGNSGAHYGIGIQSNLLQFYSDIASTDLAFGYGSSGSFTENMRIKGGGNVGIGVNNPQQNLSVKGGMNIDQAAGNGNGLTNVLRFGSSSGEAIGSNRTITTAGTNNNGLDFYTANLNRMAITNGGNVGIGTINPSQKLEVAGNAAVQGAVTVNSGKGIIQNTSGTQLKYVVTNVSVNPAGTICAGCLISIPVTFSQAFTSPPQVFVGNVTAAASGVQYFYMQPTLDNVTSTGCGLILVNTSNVAFSLNYTLNIIAIGAQ